MARSQNLDNQQKLFFLYYSLVQGGKVRNVCFYFKMLNDFCSVTFVFQGSAKCFHLK